MTLGERGCYLGIRQGEGRWEIHNFSCVHRVIRTYTLPIFTVFKLHAKGCDVCASQLDCWIQKTQNYTTNTFQANTIFFLMFIGCVLS